VDTHQLLSGAADHRSLRAALLGEGRAAVAGALRSMVGDHVALSSFRLRRAYYKPGRKLTVNYDVRVAGGPGPTPVAVMWSLGDGTLPDAGELARGEAQLRGAEFPTGFERLWAFQPSRRMMVLAAPLDPDFPGLGPMSDPASAAGALAMVPGPSPLCTVRPIRYRPGQRHVLEYRAGRSPRFFAKLYRPGRCDGVAASVSALAATLERAGVSGVRAVRPAAVLSEAGAILYREAHGTPLSEWLGTGHPGAATGLRRAGRFLGILHSWAPGPASGFGERRLEDDVLAVNRACEAMAALRPDLGVTAARVVDVAGHAIDGLEQEDPTLVHGDMKAHHLLVGAGAMHVLDADRCGRADPALDVGKLVADLRWWAWASGRGDAAAAEAELLRGYGGGGARLARARFYAALMLVKMAARRVSVAERDWERRSAQVLALAGQALLIDLATAC
jgi:hypothetical protein